MPKAIIPYTWLGDEDNYDAQKNVSDFWISTIKFNLSADLKEQIQKISDRTGQSVEEIISEWLWSSIKERFIDKERQKEMWKIIWNLSIEKLEEEVLHFIHNKPRNFAHWSEWEVFKMHIPWKADDIIVVKKEYKITWEREYNLHKKIKEIEISLNLDEYNIVKIPSVFHHFNDWNDDYLVMEYIPGKTLYLMIIEAIISQITIKYWEKIKNESEKKAFYWYYYNILKRETSEEIIHNDFEELTLDECIREISNKNWELREINIDSDDQWNIIIKNLYWILNTYWVNEAWNINSFMGVNNFIYNMIENSKFEWIWIFSELESKKLEKWLKLFIDNMQEEGFYHRDLWDNPRNIIFTSTDFWYIPSIIDFWKAKYYKTWKWDDNPFREKDEILNKSFVQDYKIIDNYIKKFIINDNKVVYNFYNKEDDKESKKENDLNKLYNIWNELNISKHNIYDAYVIVNASNETTYYKYLLNILETKEAKYVRWYKLDLWKNWDKEWNNKVLSEIIALMFFVKDENIEKVFTYINDLPKKKGRWIDYKGIYMDIYNKVSEIRKKQD